MAEIGAEDSLKVFPGVQVKVYVKPVRPARLPFLIHVAAGRTHRKRGVSDTILSVTWLKKVHAPEVSWDT
jgi:hypothetical protein